MLRSADRKFSFGLKLLIYVISFLILCAASLLVFYDFLSVYESTRIYNYIDRYKSEISENGPTSACLDAALKIADTNIFSEEEVANFASDVLREAEFKKSASKSNENLTVYTVSSQGRPLGSVSFTANHNAKFGCISWALSGEDYDFSAFCSDSSIILPPGYTAVINGKPLDSRYIISDDIELTSLKEFYKTYPELPHLTEYSTGMQLGSPSFVIRDTNGNTVSSEELTDVAFLSTQKPEDFDTLKAFCNDFITNYVQFTADVNGTHYNYYYTLLDLCVDGSELRERIHRAIDSFGFTLTKQCDITDITCHYIIKLDATHYLADLSYATRIIGRAEAVDDSRNVRLVISKHDGKYLAESMNNY